jgi:hypothetical protein
MSIYDIPESLLQAVYGVMDEAKVKKEPNRFEIGGDAYDGGVYLDVYVNNKKVHSDDRVGEQDWQYKGAKGLENVLKKLAKEHGVKGFQRVAMESVQISNLKEQGEQEKAREKEREERAKEREKAAQEKEKESEDRAKEREKKLNEATSSFNKLVSDVADMTDRNEHTKSLILIAKFIKDRRMIKRLEAIETIAMLDRHLDPNLEKYRLSLMNALMKNAKSILSKEEFEMLYGAL